MQPEIGTLKTEHTDMFVVRIVYTRYYIEQSIIARTRSFSLGRVSLQSNEVWILVGQRERERENEYQIHQGVGESTEIFGKRVENSFGIFTTKERAMYFFCSCAAGYTTKILSRYIAVFFSFLFRRQLLSLLPSAHSKAP